MFYSDDGLHLFDILRLHGNLSRDENKAQIINLFINGSEAASHLNLNILCATSGVGKAGIYSSEVRSVIRLGGFPPSPIMDMSQEKGHAGRNSTASPDNKCSYDLFFSLESFLFLYKQIMMPVEGITRINKEYQTQQLSNLMKAVELLSSHNKCFSLEFETILGNPNQTDNALPFCGHCQNCKGTKMIFPAIVKDAVIIIMLNLFVGGTRTITDEGNLDVVVKSVTEYPRPNQLILGIRAKAIIPGQIVKKILFLFMITWGIFDIKLSKETGNVVFSLAMSKTKPTNLAMQDAEYWKMIRVKDAIIETS